MNVVFTPDKQNLSKQNRATLIERLRNFLQSKADSAYPFGSCAHNERAPHSDIDLIVIAHTGLPFLERARQLALADQGGFWKSVKDSLVQIL